MEIDFGHGENSSKTLLSVYIHNDTPIASAHELISNYSSSVISIFTALKKKIYPELESISAGWDKEKTDDAIHYIGWFIDEPTIMTEEECKQRYMGGGNATITTITDEEETPEDNKQIVVEFSKPGYLSQTRVLEKDYFDAGKITLTGQVHDKKGNPIIQAKITLREPNTTVYSDSTGNFALNAQAEGKEPDIESMDIKLQKIGIKIYNQELGKAVTDSFGIVSDGFTTLKLKVIGKGVEPRTVIVKQPALGHFVEQTMLNLALAMDEDGTGEMEYIPPEYLTRDQLNKHLVLQPDSSAISPMLWVAEVPVTVTYEDEEGNPGSTTFTIFVTRPPVFLIHGFTGDETTWVTLANYLRVRKYEPIVREYYKGPADESTIERQSQKLGNYIQEVRDAYLKNHFLQKRIDIVAHSMGGLISRYYISNMARYGKTAGIYIPYNVKLSRDELKAQRFSKPVILNDVRKLVMVGTPNHGASFIDGIFGYLGSQQAGYHQIANAQLNSNSKFFEELNKGESEGRHLSPNVEYVLIYGIRKRSPYWPPDAWLHTRGTSQKEFASDDGVVTISSAKLNGVKDFPFPKDWYAPHGYIHSASEVLQKPFPEDTPITESENIFEKITELLQEDIPRMPLKNSSAKIIRANGDASYRYFSTQNWIRLKTPISPGSAKKLTNNWCRVKTGKGSATLGFFINGHQWGMLHIMPNTIAYYEYASPEFVNVYLQQGKARFKSKKQNGGGFDIVLGDKGEKWYAFNPHAKVTDLNTDFTVEEAEVIKVQSLDGVITIKAGQHGSKNPASGSLGKKQGLEISGKGTIAKYVVPEEGWWSAVDTTFLPDDTAAVLSDSNTFAFDVGDLSLSTSDSYLPMEGFSNLELSITHVPDTLLTATLSIEQNSRAGFITITNPSQQLDSLGKADFNVTISLPDQSDYATLADIPLKVRFKAMVMLASTGQVMAENEMVLPVGMTLLTGKTVDASFNPKAQPAPPELYPISFEMANQADDNGNFYLLFNTTQYKKEVDKLKKYAKRTGTPFDLNKLSLQIKWSQQSSIPLVYRLPDSITTRIKPGKHLIIGQNGNFDLLSPEEHEARIKKFVEEFATRFPLNNEAKTFLFSKLEKLKFKYNVPSVAAPTFSDNLTYSGFIEIPEDAKQFWGSEVEKTDNSAYALVFHVMGHFLQQAVVLNNHRYFNFLADNCAASKNLFTRKVDRLKYLFDKAEYVSFSEAGADFFAGLMFNFLQTKHPEFVKKSIYNNKGYLVQLQDSVNINGVKGKFPPWLVSGPQTAFLIQYYGEECTEKPALVYADFLMNQLQFARLTRGGTTAATINQWLLAKHLMYNSKSFAGSNDPNPLAAKYGLFNKAKDAIVMPRSDYSHAFVALNENGISDFSQIPAAEIKAGTQIAFGQGHFVLLLPSVDTILMIETDSLTRILTDKKEVKLLSGSLFADTPLSLKTDLASFVSTGNDYQITVAPKQTTIFNNRGVLTVSSVKEEAVIPAGYATTISKKGNIKKPKPPKKEVPNRWTGNFVLPFMF